MIVNERPRLYMRRILPWLSVFCGLEVYRNVWNIGVVLEVIPGVHEVHPHVSSLKDVNEMGLFKL
jgi:hypothetical protein